jgi:DnaJ-class molecular chaperone
MDKMVTCDWCEGHGGYTSGEYGDYYPCIQCGDSGVMRQKDVVACQEGL